MHSNRGHCRRSSPLLENYVVAASSTSEPGDLVARLAQQDPAALAALFEQHRDRLWRIVQFRLDPRLGGRVDAEDVLQEAYLNAAQRIQYAFTDSDDGVFVWFRLIVQQTLVQIHRRYFEAKSRDASRERSTHAPWGGESTSFSISSHLLGHLTSPSQAALRQELSQQLQVALESMSELDREVLTLRHFEELTNQETARVLEISQQAASLRYVRALARLKQILLAIPGLIDRVSPGLSAESSPILPRDSSAP